MLGDKGPGGTKVFVSLAQTAALAKISLSRNWRVIFFRINPKTCRKPSRLEIPKSGH